ncbi:MAG: PAS domain S-box protein [Peptococcaceae bacterium]|nr:PAS domain S-box protein [Peptococcaceae bacterium]
MEKKSLAYLSLTEKIFNNHHTAIAILDRDFNFIRVNELYAKADHRPATDFPGHNHFEFYPGDEVKAIFENVVRTKETFQILARPFVFPDNPQRGITYWDWTLVPVLDENGEVEILIFTLVDVTDQKKKEIELERFFELTHDLFCIADYNLKILRVNQAFTKEFGYCKEELIGTKITDYVYPEEISPLDSEFKNLIECSEPLLIAITRFRCKNGSYQWIEWTNTPVPGEKVFYSIGRNITERIITQTEMARLDRLNLIGQMAAGIGHEVRNPMTTVRGLLQLLGLREENSHNVKYFQLMIDEIDRANSIISEFLSLARNNPSELQLLNLNHIIDDLYPLLLADVLISNSDIVVEQTPLPDIYLNKKEIHQLLLNLVRNGLEAMKETRSGNITIKTFLENEEIVLVVMDEGPGIDPSILPKIGTPFLTTKKEGTGLGLATCFSIAERHNARIKVESRPTGTIFYIRFPLF